MLIQWSMGVDIYLDILNNLVLYNYMLFATMLVFITFGGYIGWQHQYLEKLAIRDPLTNCYNSRYFHERLHEEVDRAKRGEHKFSIIVFNLDYLRRMNKNFGHKGVDEYLAQLGRGLKKQLRGSDILARITDAEFVLLITGDNKEIPENLAERLRQYIQAFEVSAGEYSVLKTSASFGVAHYHPPQTSSDIILEAFNALKRAKLNGRNRAATQN